jgi:hypothetical protein
MLGKRTAQFSPDRKQLDRQIEEQLAALKDSDVIVELEPEQCCQGKKSLRPEFVCLICHKVVWEAKECTEEKCDTTFCGLCIDKWFEVSPNGRCPNCKKGGASQFRGLNRHHKNNLAEFSFRCSECTTTFQYNEAPAHFKKCKKRTM